MEEVLRDRVFYEESGGGVTFSGGEPLAQPDFLEALLEACRAASVHTAVDTCGFAPRERLLALAPLVDLFLFDVKLVDDARHLALTGVPAAPILENLRALAAVHANVWIRVPVVPGLTDGEARPRGHGRPGGRPAGRPPGEPPPLPPDRRAQGPPPRARVRARRPRPAAAGTTRDPRRALPRPRPRRRRSEAEP